MGSKCGGKMTMNEVGETGGKTATGTDPTGEVMEHARGEAQGLVGPQARRSGAQNSRQDGGNKKTKGEQEPA
jgi:hypothetical protein